MKITPGEWKICMEATNEKGVTIHRNTPTHLESHGIIGVELIAETVTVKNETGFSPRQLADRNKKLLEAVKEAIRHVVESCTRLGLDHTKHSTWQKCNKLIKPTKI